MSDRSGDQKRTAVSNTAPRAAAPRRAEDDSARSAARNDRDGTRDESTLSRPRGNTEDPDVTL